MYKTRELHRLLVKAYALIIAAVTFSSNFFLVMCINKNFVTKSECVISKSIRPLLVKALTKHF